MTGRLTDHDRRVIAEARELAGPDAVREHAGEHSTMAAYVITLGRVQTALCALADIIGRMVSEKPGKAPEAGRGERPAG